MNPGEIAGRSFIFDTYLLLLYIVERFIEKFLDKYFFLVKKVYGSKTTRSISSSFPLVDCFRNLYEKLENVRRDKRNSLKKKGGENLYKMRPHGMLSRNLVRFISIKRSNYTQSRVYGTGERSRLSVRGSEQKVRGDAISRIIWTRPREARRRKNGSRGRKDDGKETVWASKVNPRSHEIPHGVLHAAYLHQRRIAFRASAGTRDV